MSDTLTASTDSCTIPVTGMTCAACSSRVQRTLERTDGVSSANVNLMTGAATVAYDPSVTSPERLVDTIRGTGYGAELPLPNESSEALLDAQDAARAEEVRDLRGKFALGATVGLGIMALAMTPTGSGDIGRYAALALTLPVVGWAGRHFYTRAWAAFRHHGADMNTLIAVGTGAAFVFSAVVTVFDDWFAAHGVEPHVYYEAVVWIIALVLLGNLLEARAKGRTSGAIRRLIGLRPATARVLRDGREEDVPLATLRAGDEVLVRPGETIPADGTVLDGASNVDESHAHRRADAGAEASRATGSSAPRSTGTARSASGSSGWGTRPCSRGSSAWCSRRRAARRRSSGWPTASRRCSSRWCCRSRSLTFVRLVRPRARAGLPARPRVRGDRADHRLPLRHGARRADRGDGRDRPRRRAGRAHQGRRGARAEPGARHGRLRQDRHDHRGPSRGTGGRARRPGRGVASEADLLELAAAVERLSEHPLADAIVARGRAEGAAPRAERPTSRAARARACSGRWPGAGVAVGNARAHE